MKYCLAFAFSAAILAVGGTSRAQCATDIDCKGDRICQGGVCVDAASAPGQAPAPQPGYAPQPAPAPAPPPGYAPQQPYYAPPQPGYTQVAPPPMPQVPREKKAYFRMN